MKNVRYARSYPIEMICEKRVNIVSIEVHKSIIHKFGNLYQKQARTYFNECSVCLKVHTMRAFSIGENYNLPPFAAIWKETVYSPD